MYVEKNSACGRHRKAGRDAVKKSRMETGRGRLRIDKPELKSKQFELEAVTLGWPAGQERTSIEYRA